MAGLSRKARRRLMYLGVLMAAVFVLGAALGVRAALRVPAVPDGELAAEVEETVAAVISSGFDQRQVVAEIVPGCSRGVITLTGVISDERVRSAVTQALARLRGVRRVIDEVLLLPDPRLGEKRFGILSSPVVNLGDAPGSDEDKHLVTQGLLGMVVDLLQEKDGCYRVRMADGYLGWVRADRLVRTDAAGVKAWQEGPRAVVAARSARIYDGPSKGSRVIAEATMGTVLPTATGTPGGGPARIGLPGGKSGWVDLAAIRIAPSEAEAFADKGGADAVIAAARQFVGLPYLWGGTSPKGFDCGGLIQFVFRINGYALPRDADQQYEVGRAVADRSQLQPGDLVFFSTYKPGPSQVGIYVGNGKYISAVTSGVIVYSFLSGDKEFSPSMDKQYLGARRVIK